MHKSSHPLNFQVLVRNLQFQDGKMIPASKYFSADETTTLELTEEEKKMAEDIKVIQLTASVGHYYRWKHYFILMIGVSLI